MINIREDTIFLCGVDGARLKLVQGKYSLYYRCEKYEVANRTVEDGSPCMNRISLKDQDTLFEKLEEMQENGKLTEGESGNYMHLLYEIKKIDEDYLEVYVINKYKVKLD